MRLNERAVGCCEYLTQRMEPLRIQRLELANGAVCWDFGVESAASGGLEAGRQLARVCLADLGQVRLAPDDPGVWTGPAVTVWTDHPIMACMASQYAGWKIQRDDYFAMGSGPMRAAAGTEALLEQLHVKETVSQAVGVLESSRLPSVEVTGWIAAECGVPPEGLQLLVARTSSIAGTVQVVARSVETALHKLMDLGFDLRRVVSGWGTAPLPPVAADDLTGIGRTNDAILYGGRVTLWVRGDDASLAEIVPQMPSRASRDFGKPFREIFAQADHDFYQIDPHLFSPARVCLTNLDTGRTFHAGQTEPAILQASFVDGGSIVKLGLLASPDSWYFRDLQRAAGSQFMLRSLSFAQLAAGLAERPWVASGPDDSLDDLDAVLVRTMPPGSLEQIVFRMDALHRLAASGTPVFNPPRCLEMRRRQVPGVFPAAGGQSANAAHHRLSNGGCCDDSVPFVGTRCCVEASLRERRSWNHTPDRRGGGLAYLSIAGAGRCGAISATVHSASRVGSAAVAAGR